MRPHRLQYDVRPAAIAPASTISSSTLTSAAGICKLTTTVFLGRRLPLPFGDVARTRAGAVGGALKYSPLLRVAVGRPGRRGPNSPLSATVPPGLDLIAHFCSDGFVSHHEVLAWYLLSLSSSHPSSLIFLAMRLALRVQSGITLIILMNDIPFGQGLHLCGGLFFINSPSCKGGSWGPRTLLKEGKTLSLRL